jgi:hypothetical protein
MPSWEAVGLGAEVEGVGVEEVVLPPPPQAASRVSAIAKLRPVNAWRVTCLQEKVIGMFILQDLNLE